jgi:DivIVA domain-containing protein
MVAFVAFVVGVLVVAGLLFLGASLLLGRGETQPPAELDRSPVALPDDRPVTADDVRALQLSVALRGYRMTEVDWLLDQFGLVLEERDAEIARLRQQATPQPAPHPQGAPPPKTLAPKTPSAPASPDVDPEPQDEEPPHA